MIWMGEDTQQKQTPLYGGFSQVAINPAALKSGTGLYGRNRGP